MTIEAASTASGKVVDGSALTAWAKGNLAMATWREMAWVENLTLVVPIDARSEAVRARPGDVALIDYFLAAPNVLTRADPEADDVRAIDQHHDHGVFDPVTSWTAGLARRREWSVLTGDTARVRRIDAGVIVDEV